MMHDKIITTPMIQVVKKLNDDTKLDEFSNILLHQLERFKFIPMRESQPGSELTKHESTRAKKRA